MKHAERIRGCGRIIPLASFLSSVLSAPFASRRKANLPLWKANFQVAFTFYSLIGEQEAKKKERRKKMRETVRRINFCATDALSDGTRKGWGGCASGWNYFLNDSFAPPFVFHRGLPLAGIAGDSRERETRKLEEGGCRRRQERISNFLLCAIFSRLCSSPLLPNNASRDFEFIKKTEENSFFVFSREQASEF